MGLDMTWHLPEGKPHPKFNPPLDLCSCFYLDSGELVFGDYAVYLYDITGYPMHVKKIDEYFVKRISEELSHVRYSKWIKDTGFTDMPRDELKDLKRMFKAYAKLDGWLTVSW